MKISERFDPEFCGRVCRAAAITCVSITLCTAIFLATQDSSKCPGWMFRSSEGVSLSIWPLLLMAGFTALVVSYYAVTWKRFAKRLLDNIHWGEATVVRGTQSTQHDNWSQFFAEWATVNDFNRLCVVVMIGLVLFTAAPLIVIAMNCS